MLTVGAGRYRALVVPRTESVPVRIAQKIASLVLAGFPVALVADVPFRSVGFFAHDQNDLLVRASFEQMFGVTRDVLLQSPKTLTGSALFVTEVGALGRALVTDLHLTPDVILGANREFINYVHRRTASADYFFVVGSSAAPFDALISFPNALRRAPEIFDLPTGRTAVAPVYSHQGDRTVLPVHLAPGVALVVGFETADTGFHLEATDLPFVTRDEDGVITAAARFAGTYTVTMQGRTVNVKIPSPGVPPIHIPVWDLITVTHDAGGQLMTRSFPGVFTVDLAQITGLPRFSGVALYASVVNIGPEYLTLDRRVVLNLGQVNDTAEVRVNGHTVATLLAAPFRVDITDLLVPGTNRIDVGVTPLPGGSPSGLLGPVTLIPLYKMQVDEHSGIPPASIPFSVVISPANFPAATDDAMFAAIARAGELVKHVNLQWFWKTPPNAAFPDGGPVVNCATVTRWVTEARRLGLGVTLQFQTFVTELAPGGSARVRIASPVMPLDTATFGNRQLRDAYLAEIACLAELHPDYLALGPEMNFVFSFAAGEFERFRTVYRDAYTLLKTFSPTTQVGLSWQYDGLRNALPLDTWGYIPYAGPQDFIGLTTYFGYSDDRFLEYPVAGSIPADYYEPIRVHFGPDVPIVFTEVGYPSFFPEGLQQQAEFLRRLPGLLDDVKPVSVTWALLHDVDYFVGPIRSLNDSGLLTRTGKPKPVWDEAMRLTQQGVLMDVVPRVASPEPLPFAVTAVPSEFPTVRSSEKNLEALASAAELSGHVSLQFAWRDRVTGEVWGCEAIRPYIDEARRRALGVTLQFNVYAVVPPRVAGEKPYILLLNPVRPPEPDGSGDQPSFSNPEIRDAFLREVECIASLGPDYLVLGPEVNFLFLRSGEFDEFSSIYREAYRLAKQRSPSTLVGTSYQYDGVRENIETGAPIDYVRLFGPQDFLGLTSYFAASAERHDLYPSVTDIPADYYLAARGLLPDVPIVFTEIGWSTFFPKGRENQTLFLNRLPTLLQAVRPVNVIWPLMHDVLGYFPGENEPINHLGLRQYDGTPKPGWDRAVWLRSHGLLTTPTSVAVR
jgi:hypothetical protein